MYIYKKYHSASFKDPKMCIFILCIISSVYTFVHYSVMEPGLKAATFFIFNIFNFVIFFLLCFYYMSKANSLLENKKVFMYRLKAFFAIGISSIMIFGVVIWIMIDRYNKESSVPVPFSINISALCTSPVF